MDSSWRHLDLGGRVCRLRMRRRLACPKHGAVTKSVPFARPGARFTADFEDLVVWLVTRSDKTTIAAFARVAWRTMCERVAPDVMDLIDRWCSRAQRSRIPRFVKAAATIRKNKDGSSAAIERPP